MARGFASMTPERRREIAAAGGRAVPADKRSFNNRQLAVAAGRRGGSAKHKSNETETKTK